MELKDLIKIEDEIRKWAGKTARIELEHDCLSSGDNYYIRVSNGKGIHCLVNPERLDEPYGLYFDEREDQIDLIKWLFKNAKK